MNITINSLQTKHFNPHAGGLIAKEKTNKQEAFQSTNSLNLVDTNHNQLLIKRNNLSFKGGMIPFMPPLEKRISAALQGLTPEDLILVGKNLTEAKKLLKESINGISKVIKRLFFIEEPTIKSSFIITQNPHGLYDLMNLDKKPILLKTLESNIALVLKQGEFSYVTPSDGVVLANGATFKIQKGAEQSMDEIKKANLQLFDFSSYDSKAITNLNAKHLDLMVEEGVKTEIQRKITFADVGGQDDAIKELKRSILYPIKYPSAYPAEGLSKGVILTGGPGTGKSLMAEALANEVDAHFIKLNGLEMESKWVGETEANWRALFDEAKNKQPSIIFIDEFDAVARTRDGSSSGRYDNKVVNQLLTLMSDLEKSNDQVFVVTATNKIDLLDDAIKRSGRFGKYISVEKPNATGCKKILEIHAGKSSVKVDPAFDQEKFAQKLFDSSVSGADISQIVADAKQASYARANIFEKMENGTFTEKDITNLKINAEDFEEALEKFRAQQLLNNGEVGLKKLNKIGFDFAPTSKISKTA